MLRWSWVFMALMVAACTDPAPAGAPAKGTSTDIAHDSAIADTVAAPADPGVAPSWDATDVVETDIGDLGQPCATNADCDSGWCVQGKESLVCTVACIEDCPAGWTCKQIPIAGADLQFACAPEHATLCRPCMQASDCATAQDPYAECRALASDGATGHFCATACDVGTCPVGYDCVDGDGGHKLCSPQSGACECDALAVSGKLSTTCLVANDLGTCPGTLACGPGGLSACDAHVPAAETCNGVDDDCDGETDEGQGDLDKDKIVDCLDPDIDGDGTLNPQDCEPEDFLVHPGQIETCNGKDDDCDLVVDNPGASGCSTWYLDKDADGYGVETATKCQCGALGDYSAEIAGDCDDQNGNVNPAAKEVCDGLDNDCDGDGDTAGLPGCVPWYVDGDLDGHGHPSKWKCLCGAEGAHVTAVGDDCDDTSSLTHPDAPEICDGEDNDCDGRVDIPATASPECPADCDGQQACAEKCAVSADCTSDCGPGEAVCLGGAPSGCTAPPTTTCLDPKDGCAKFTTCGECPPMPAEKCNGKDDDCDFTIDEGVKVTLYTDGDGDGHGKPGTGFSGCAGAPGSATVDDDCNDADSDVYPKAPEICDGVDQDCDGTPDDGVELVFFDDKDGDGFGDSATASSACAAPPGTTEKDGDCAVDDPDVYPGAPEVCNGKDESCDGLTDEAWPTLGEPCDGADADPCPDGKIVCAPTQASVLCEDAESPLVESCNGVDDDCNGQTDELWPTLGQPCDGDDADLCDEGAVGCDAAGTQVTCVELGGGHVEACNGQDDDCNGQTDEAWPALGDPCDGADADVCAEGVTECAANGASTTCVESGPSHVEACNQQDDDCDGDVDEAWPLLGSPCDGSDADMCKNGQIVCTADGGATECQESGPNQVELCNGEDDDCDGNTDEGFEQKGTPCDGFDADDCEDGVLVCNGFDLECNDGPEAAAELCNGKDDTCDGTVDEGFELKGAPCDGADDDECQEGTWKCDGTDLVCSDATGAKFEACNGQDDDCDGEADEGNPGGGVACTVIGLSGECKTGQTECVSGKTVCQQVVFSVPESCNGLDDDCDGKVDGFTESCDNACYSGTRTCYSGNFGACSAPTPQCTSGPCCDGCKFKSSSVQCGNGAEQTVQKCQGSCGGSVVKESLYRYCSGSSGECTGSTKWLSEGTVDWCSSGELCTASGSSGSSAYCKSCSCGCSSGQCTVNNTFKKICSNSDVYWSDCNGSPTTFVEDCGSCACSGGACLVTDTSQTTCSGGNVYYKTCKGGVGGFKQSCCGGLCSGGKCSASTSEVIVDDASSGFTPQWPNGWTYKAYRHTDGSADGWFDTGAYGTDNRFLYAFGGKDGSKFGTFKTPSKLNGTYTVSVHQPNPDAFDPDLNSGTQPNTYIKCTSITFKVVHDGNLAGEAVVSGMGGSGWLNLGTFKFCDDYGEVRWNDASGPKNCAVSYDAVRWQAQ